MGLNRSSSISIILIITIIIVIVLFIVSGGGSCKENYNKYIEKYYNGSQPSDSANKVFSDAIADTSVYSKTEVKHVVREQYFDDNAKKAHALIEHVLYINLPTRQDRNRQAVGELEILDLPYTRIEGVVNNFGGLGCSEAHLKALQYAKDHKFKNVLICEDDIMFKHNREKLHEHLVKGLVHLGNDYDVLLLTGGKVKSTSIPATKNLKHVTSAQTRTAYLVNSGYYDTLIQNFEDNIRELSSRGPESYAGNVSDQPRGKGFAGDQYWKHLQQLDRWFIMNPRLCRQRKSYSNIQKQVMYYKDS